MEGRVNVLLGTYNGARFLSEQLRSIDLQTLPAARVTIRDDGSTDDTIAHLEGWSAGRANVTLLRGSRLGVIHNFLTLLSAADEDCEYFAFCDQDDVWMPGKLERAVAELRRCPPSVPAMYCSRLEFVNEKLEHLGYSEIYEPSFANALVQDIASGCTVVLNRKARELICRRPPQKAKMHDWWCYLVISALGEVIYDDTPSIKYRKHGNNVDHATSDRLENFKRRVLHFLKWRRNAMRPSDQAAELHRCFGDLLSPERKAILERFLRVRGTLWMRLSYATAMDVWRQSPVDTSIMRGLILLGRI